MNQVLSRFTYEVERTPSTNDGSLSLIYNSHADSLAQIPSALFDALKEKQPELLKKYKKELSTLVEEGFLVNHDVDELRALRIWYDDYIKNKECLDVTVLLSYRCNFACPYCFETKVLGNTRMAQEIQDGIIAWIKHDLLQHQIPALHVTFFGGEPLVEKQLLFRLATELRQWCHEQGKHFDFSMITNGFHLTSTLYEELKKLGLVHVKVTIDGDKEQHDKQRPLKGGRGSFETILKNLKDIGVLTSFTLGGNFDSSKPESADSVIRLLDRLKAEGLDKTVGRFAFKPIQDAGLEATGSMVSGLEDGEMDNFLRLEAELKRRKLPRTRRIDTGPCDAHKEHSIAIDPKGDIYPCGAFAGDKRACIGNVLSGRNDNYDKVMGYTAFDSPKCTSCQHLPGCFGGCRWVALTQHGDYRSENCSKTYFEKTAAQLLKMEAGLITPGKEVSDNENHS